MRDSIPRYILDLRIGSGILADALALAEVAELADAHDSNSCSFGIEGSIPSFGTQHYTLMGTRTNALHMESVLVFAPHRPIRHLSQIQ